MHDSTYLATGIVPGALHSLRGQLQNSAAFRELAQRAYPGRKLQERQERLARGDELSQLYLTANVTESLVLLALQKDLPAAKELLDMVCAAESVVPPIPANVLSVDARNDEVPHFGSEAYVAMAIAHSAWQAAPPEPHWLRIFAVGVAEHYAGRSKGTLHAVQQKLLIEGVICALLADDLELAVRIAQIRSSLSTSKLLFPFLKRLIKQAQVQQIEGRDVVRIMDPALGNESLVMLDHFRRRVGTDYKFPGDSGAYFGMIEGAYLWSWLHLRTCNPQPVLHSDWNALGDLLIG